MNKLLDFLNALPAHERAGFAARCGTTVGYLRKAVSVGQRLNAELCINIERESRGAVPCEATRPDITWSVLRDQQAPTAADNTRPACSQQAQEAV